MTKIFTEINKEDFAEKMDKIRKTKKIVTINGCFDIIHLNHFKILHKAKCAGDILVVGLNSDISVKRLKGKGRPILDQDERAKTLLFLPYVDYVYIYNEDTPEDFIRMVKPDTHVNDSFYGDNCVEKKVVEEFGGKLYIVNKFSGISTSEIISRIDNFSKELKNAEDTGRGFS